MAWDPTFDWANASSFNGEPRKYSILTEMITQVNLKRNFLGLSLINSTAIGNVLGIVKEIDDKLQELFAYYGEDLESIELAIGTPNPPHSFGNVFTPTWVNWVYQAMQLLTSLKFYSDYWNGVADSSAVVGDANFDYRWTDLVPTNADLNITGSILNIGNTVFAVLPLVKVYHNFSTSGLPSIYSMQVDSIIVPADIYIDIRLHPIRIKITSTQAEVYHNTTLKTTLVGAIYSTGQWRVEVSGNNWVLKRNGGTVASGTDTYPSFSTVVDIEVALTGIVGLTYVNVGAIRILDSGGNEIPAV